MSITPDGFTPKEAPIFILKKHWQDITPGRVEWTDICRHRGPCWVVKYESSRPVGRWHSEERKRPWMIFYSRSKPVLHSEWSTHKTLELALAAIKRAEKELSK